MAWTTPRTWVAGELVTAALMNTHIRDNENILKTSIANDGTLASTNGLLITPEVRAPRGTMVQLTIAAGNVALDASAGDLFRLPVTANWQLVVSNLPASPKWFGFYLTTIGNGTDYTDGFVSGATVHWPGSVTPTVTTTNNHEDQYFLLYDGLDTKWYGYVVGQDST